MKKCSISIVLEVILRTLCSYFPKVLPSICQKLQLDCEGCLLFILYVIVCYHQDFSIEEIRQKGAGGQPVVDGLRKGQSASCD